MRISVILPIFNAEKFIKNSLSTLTEYLKNPDLEKDLEHIQLILVNDGSTDNTSNEINEFIDNFPTNSKFEINLISYKTNRNIGFAIKQGLQKAKNEIIIIMDCDLPFKLDIINQSLELIKSCDIVSIDRTKIKGSYDVPLLRMILHKGLILLIKLMFWKEIQGIDDFVAGFKVVKKELVDKIKNYFISDTSLIHFEIILLTQILNKVDKKQYQICFVYPHFNRETIKDTTYSFMKIVKVVLKILKDLISIKIKIKQIKKRLQWS